MSNNTVENNTAENNTVEEISSNKEERKVRTTKNDLTEYIKFTFRDDIAELLKSVKLPHKVSIKLFEKETGIKISSQTAYKNRNRWIVIDGEVYKKS